MKKKINVHTNNWRSKTVPPFHARGKLNARQSVSALKRKIEPKKRTVQLACYRGCGRESRHNSIVSYSIAEPLGDCFWLQNSHAKGLNSSRLLSPVHVYMAVPVKALSRYWLLLTRDQRLLRQELYSNTFTNQNWACQNRQLSLLRRGPIWMSKARNPTYIASCPVPAGFPGQSWPA